MINSMNMKSIVSEVLSSYEVEIEKRNISVHTKIEDVRFVGNQQQVHTLLNNLISNAIKYNKDEGFIFIDIKEEENAIKEKYAADINTYADEQRQKWIMGAEDVDATWDKYVATLESMHLDEVTKIYQAAYDRKIGK